MCEQLCVKNVCLFDNCGFLKIFCTVTMFFHFLMDNFINNCVHNLFVHFTFVNNRFYTFSTKTIINNCALNKLKRCIVVLWTLPRTLDLHNQTQPSNWVTYCLVKLERESM